MDLKMKVSEDIINSISQEKSFIYNSPVKPKSPYTNKIEEEFTEKYIKQLVNISEKKENRSLLKMIVLLLRIIKI